ncbi:Dephospho-CoA kinase [Nosema bombycis CQ1]|uniref:Dephospho-CoA kinase n=1 Tax=Nosema bombycis (strain CQ1 / CVCC 102059) TaxID=578461 RepID=R0KTX1_NOSB1|nr:Dephospho-CoA kinase [Nosema bombycis CQ1]|eukprot:EOB13682.1 Dephospho-CoA kinase [Nosema bombycis CQ1]
MKLVMVTGGLKTGKSTFLNYLRKFGYYTISCDEIIKNILKLLRIDKKWIIRHFFTNKIFRRVYLCVIIPIMFLIVVLKLFIALILGKSLIFIEMPLLYEYRLNCIFYNIVVWTTKEEQMKRIERSGVSKEFLKMQMPLEYKKQKADYLIVNNGDISDLKKKAMDLCDDCLNLYQIMIILFLIYLL